MTLKINKQLIRSLNPCPRGYRNFVKYYNDFNGSLKEFLKLKSIPQDDKDWLLENLIDEEFRRLFLDIVISLEGRGGNAKERFSRRVLAFKMVYSFNNKV